MRLGRVVSGCGPDERTSFRRTAAAHRWVPYERKVTFTATSEAFEPMLPLACVRSRGFFCPCIFSYFMRLGLDLWVRELTDPFRLADGRIPSACRYFATVRRAMLILSRRRISAIAWSESGLWDCSTVTIARIFFLDGFRADIFAATGFDARGEEELQFENALRRMRVFVGGRAADGRFVHSDIFRDVLQHQRAQTADAMIEKRA